MSQEEGNIPLVSCIIPVRNREEFIGAAIRSVLNQTFENLELLVLDDGSTDGTLSVCEEFSDSRLRIFSRPARGIVETLNYGIALANGKYIARLDSDDIALESRFQKQVDFLESNPDYGLVGGWMLTFGDRLVLRKFPSKDPDVKVALLFENPFGASSVMFRRNWENGQPGEFRKDLALNGEDFEYWVRMSALWKCANFPEVLALYRTHENQSTKTSTEARTRLVQSIVVAQHEALGSKPPSPGANLWEEWIWWQAFTNVPAVREKFDSVSLRRQRRLRLFAHIKSRAKGAFPSFAMIVFRAMRRAIRKMLSRDQTGALREIENK